MDYRRLAKEIEEKMNTQNPDIKYGTNLKKERKRFLIAGILAYSIFLILVALFIIFWDSNWRLVG